MGDNKPNEVQQTYLGSSPSRVDFNKSDFTKLLSEKGRVVIFEKALVCPCKAASSNQLSSCQNCGGTGFVFVNPTELRMILSGVKLNPQQAPWSNEWNGTVNITANPEVELSFMDRITLTDAESILSEVLPIKKKDDTWFTRFTYLPKSIDYIGLFVDSDVKLTKLTAGIDYTIDNNYLTLINEDLIPENTESGDLSVTIRYKHSPVYYVREMLRETMQSFELKLSNEELIHLPISALGQKAHYVLKDKVSLSGATLLDNNY